MAVLLKTILPHCWHIALLCVPCTIFRAQTLKMAGLLKPIFTELNTFQLLALVTKQTAGMQLHRGQSVYRCAPAHALLPGCGRGRFRNRCGREDPERPGP